MSNFIRLRDGINLGYLIADPATATKGDIYFNTISNTLRIYNGTTWDNASVSTDLLEYFKKDGSVHATGDFYLDNHNLYNVASVLGNNGSFFNVSAFNGDGMFQSQGGNVFLVSQDNTTPRNILIKTNLNGASPLPTGINSGQLNIETNGVDNANSGNMFIKTGTVTGAGTRGTIYVEANIIDVNNTKITSHPDPTNPQDVSNKNYVDNSISGLSSVYIPQTEKGAALGVATLDGGGKVPSSQLPSSLMTYQGNWDALTNTPTLVDGVGDIGDVYRVSVAGTQDLGSGPIIFAVGDWAIYTASNIWEKSLNSNAVVSVNGFTGIVTLGADDVAAANQTLSNLTSPTAINQDLLPNTANAFKIGDGTNRWDAIYATSHRVSGSGGEVAGNITNFGTDLRIIASTSELRLEAVNNIIFDSPVSYNSLITQTTSTNTVLTTVTQTIKTFVALNGAAEFLIRAYVSGKIKVSRLFVCSDGTSVSIVEYGADVNSPNIIYTAVMNGSNVDVKITNNEASTATYIMAATIL